MRRRDVLRTSVTALGLSLPGAVPGASATAVARAPTNDGMQFEPLGKVSLEGAKEAVVADDGTVVYVAVGDGFVSVDIEDPANPSILAERRDIETPGEDPFHAAWDVKTDGDRLIVVGPAQHSRRAARGFALFDVSDPANPIQLTFHETDFHVHNAHFADDVVFLTGSGLAPQALVTIDVSGDDPVELTRWTLANHDASWLEVDSTLSQLHDIYVQHNIAYLLFWNAGTWLVDVSDPAQPTVLSTVEAYTADELSNLGGRERIFTTLTPPGNHHYGQVDDSGALLGIGTESWAVEFDDELVGGPGGIELYDVSDSRNPEFRAKIAPPESFDQTMGGWFTTVHNFDFAGDRLYSAWYYGGVQIHDVSDPANPERIAWWRNPRNTSFWTAQSVAAGETFVATSSDPTAELGIDDPAVPIPGEALYVFPDHAGEQANPQSLTEPPGTVGETNDSDNRTSADGTVDTEDGTNGNESTDGAGPGFGPVSALAGVGGFGYAVLRRLTDESRDD